MRGLFGVKRGLKLTHFGILWPQIIYLLRVFREAILAFLAPDNAPFWSFQAPEAFLELKGALYAHILAFFGPGSCTFLDFLGTLYLKCLFGVKRGLKLTHFGIFWPQII